MNAAPPFDMLPANSFGALLADPPWHFQSWTNGRWKGDGKVFTPAKAPEYATMSVQQIAALPVHQLAAPDCALFMWGIWVMLPQVLRVISDWGFCVATGTRILKDDLRWAAAEDLRIGDRLLCFDENLVNGRRYYRWGRVVSTGIEKHPCSRIRLADGRELVATTGHKWLVHNGSVFVWATADQVSSDYNGVRKRGWKFPVLAPVQELEDSYEGGFLAAAFDSEGHLRKAKCGLGFSQKQNPLMRAVQSMLEARKFNFEEYSYPEHQNCDQIVIDNRMDTMRFLMQFRPPRLMGNWIAHNSPYSLYNLPCIDVDHVDDAGVRDVVTLQTDVGTYIAEGFGAHNTYKTCAFNWSKADVRQIDMFADNAQTQLGLGYWVRQDSEFCLLATRGRPKRRSTSVHQGIIEPRREPSRKPDCVHRRIEQLVDGPYLELFARQQRPGWTTWGDEVNKFSRADATPNLAPPTKPIASLGSAVQGPNSGFDSRDGSQL